MPNDENVGFIAAQLTIARWYLDRAAGSDGVAGSNHLRSARQAFDVVVTLLPKLTLRVDDETYTDFQKQLAALRARLRAAGQPV